MGAWGPGLLQDDVALDTMDMMEDALEEGLSIQQATRRILDDPPCDLDDEDDGPTTYLALAVLQLQRGVLEPHIRDLALGAIASGAAMGRWEGAPEDVVAPRREVLRRTEEILRRGSCTPGELQAIIEPPEHRSGPWILS
jgi:hypothetical protein